MCDFSVSMSVFGVGGLIGGLSGVFSQHKNLCCCVETDCHLQHKVKEQM